MMTPFELPEDGFTAGTYRVFKMNALNDGKPLDLSRQKVHFSLSDYVNGGAPAVSKPASISQNNEVFSIVRADLTPEETKNLKGKYIYQFSILDPGSPAYVARGLVTIYRNIDVDALNG